MYSNTFTAYCVGKIPINLMPEVRDEYPVLRVTDVINTWHICKEEDNSILYLFRAGRMPC